MSLHWSQSSSSSHFTQKENGSIYNDLESQHDLVFLKYFFDFIFFTSTFFILFQPSVCLIALRRPGMSMLWGISTCYCSCLYTFFLKYILLTPIHMFLYKYYLLKRSFLAIQIKISTLIWCFLYIFFFPSGFILFINLFKICFLPHKVGIFMFCSLLNLQHQGEYFGHSSAQ